MTYNTSLLILVLLFAVSVSQAHVDLDFPKGGESFFPSSEIIIKWTESQSHGESNYDLFYSDDGGTVWQEIALDLAESSREYTWNTPGKETFKALIKVTQDNKSGTDYDGVSQVFTVSNTPGDIEEPGIITALEDVTDLSENELQLSNFPNPFISQTTIQFSISQKSHVQLNVYNTLGKMVFAAVNETFDEGTYEFLWKSHGFPGGIYLCKLMVNDQKIVNKMVLSP